jgi:hypothetical protein
MAPLVSVVLPAYNAEGTLGGAIRSILEQSVADLELLVVDDGSIDGTARVVRDFASRDGRVRLLEPGHVGFGRALNLGLEVSQGVWIARMDADDESLPRRLERQIDFLERNPGISVCGTWTESFGSEETTYRYPTEPGVAAAGLLFTEVPVCHASVMFRGDWLRARRLRYEPESYPIEDYVLWLDVISDGAISNVPEVLFRYRRGAESMSSGHRTEAHFQKHAHLWERELRVLGIAKSATDETAFECFARKRWNVPQGELDRLEKWLVDLLEANRAKGRFPEAGLRRRVAELWGDTCRILGPPGIAAAFRFLASPLLPRTRTGPRALLRLVRPLLGRVRREA